MQSKPIIFSGPMVRAILEGRKTQTRRIVKPNSWVIDISRCPYGHPGDHLWVRETFGESGYKRLEYKAFPADGKDFRCVSRWKPSIHMPRWASRINLLVKNVRVERLQDISEEDAKAEGVYSDEMRPDYHDYRSNLWMCDRCAGTGLHASLGPNMGVIEDVDCVDCDTSKKRFKQLWQLINGYGSWDANPYVWVIEFERVMG